MENDKNSNQLFVNQSSYENQVATNKMSWLALKPRKNALVIFAVLLFIAGSLWIFLSVKNIPQNKPSTPIATTPSKIPQSLRFPGDFEVIIKENANDKRKSDIYLESKGDGEKFFFTTFEDVYSYHYHPAEYHNGNLYLLTRPRGKEIYQSNPKWTDELVRIDINKNVKKLYSTQGIDFRVSDDEKRIAINLSDKLIIVDGEGKHIKSIPSSQLTIGENIGYGFLAWGEESIWLDNAFGPTLLGIIKIDLNSYQITKFDLSKYKTGIEYVLNTKTQQLAFTDYPPMFDVESKYEFDKSGKKITLTIYDAKTKIAQEIATSITKSFSPKWISDKIIEYNDPYSDKRIVKQIF